MTERINRRRKLLATVVSDKMNKTRVVRVAWRSKHAKYEKQMQHSAKYKAHDENNSAKIGDVVEIMESRPISKDKRWIITNIVKKETEK